MKKSRALRISLNLSILYINTLIISRLIVKSITLSRGAIDLVDWEWPLASRRPRCWQVWKASRNGAMVHMKWIPSVTITSHGKSWQKNLFKTWQTTQHIMAVLVMHKKVIRHSIGQVSYRPATPPTFIPLYKGLRSQQRQMVELRALWALAADLLALYQCRIWMEQQDLHVPCAVPQAF